ncbi:Retrovirus-related Pol polyprotein from transposon TNT 1-94 [Vitis vinifera]|uniref:Retrovirus-related Pol polyprotein from transposon TNT 1-94 n=1 Tax=Vitis vinifera TaxID=29760 RepID=A0A438FZ84_VITVI|nr:Retrovirus-related Pol polyprotein from transposon TNT 1-94 [Vitis vinifera]
MLPKDVDHLYISKNLQCFCCKEYGHIDATCPKKLCSYCKKKGHIIKECRTRPQNRQAQAFQTSVIVLPVATSVAHDSLSVACSVPAPDYCTPEMVQRMLISALSAMGFEGNNSTKLCSLPIAAIGDASSKFIDVFLAPQLSNESYFFGQLVDNNCAVNFLVLVWCGIVVRPSNTQILSHVLNSDLPGNKDRSSLSLECDSCKLGKSKTLPFPLHTSRASHCFDLIHSDVGDLPRLVYMRNLNYYVTFIDDHSRFTWVYFLRSKSEVFCTFTKFLAYVDNQFSTSIKTLRTNSDGEYLFTEFQAFLASKGIIHQRSCPSTPQQNGVAERKNRHLLDGSRSSSSQFSAFNQVWISLFQFWHSILALTAGLSNFDIPTCYSHAAKHDCWRQAMQEEIAALKANHTWDIEPCPPTIVPLGCKWVYSVKVRSNGSFDRYKARLVALENNQEYGVNYEETFAPVAKMTIVRMILALAASNDWPLYQMDVHHSPSGISLNQHKYASDLVATAGLQGATFVDTPMELNVKLRKEESYLLVDPNLYRKLQVSQFLQTPRHLHRLLSVGSCAMFKALLLVACSFPVGNSTRLAAYSDAD